MNASSLTGLRLLTTGQQLKCFLHDSAAMHYNPNCCGCATLRAQQHQFSFSQPSVFLLLPAVEYSFYLWEHADFGGATYVELVIAALQVNFR